MQAKKLQEKMKVGKMSSEQFKNLKNIEEIARTAKKAGYLLFA